MLIWFVILLQNSEYVRKFVSLLYVKLIVGMYLNSGGFQLMREGISTFWNHALKLWITLRLGQII